MIVFYIELFEKLIQNTCTQQKIKEGGTLIAPPTPPTKKNI